jgi:hypothetical protein
MEEEGGRGGFRPTVRGHFVWQTLTQISLISESGEQDARPHTRDQDARRRSPEIGGLFILFITTGIIGRWMCGRCQRPRLGDGVSADSRWPGREAR